MVVGVVMVVVVVVWSLSLQIRRVLVDVVDLGLVVDGVGRVFGDDVPRMDQSGEVAEDTEEDVDEGVGGADSSSDPHGQRREKHRNNDKTNV